MLQQKIKKGAFISHLDSCLANLLSLLDADFWDAAAGFDLVGGMGEGDDLFLPRLWCAGDLGAGISEMSTLRPAGGDMVDAENKQRRKYELETTHDVYNEYIIQLAVRDP